VSLKKSSKDRSDRRSKPKKFWRTNVHDNSANQERKGRGLRGARSVMAAGKAPTGDRKRDSGEESFAASDRRWISGHTSGGELQ